MKKMKIEKVWIERRVDNYPDTSFLGEYTDKADSWNICRHCGEYVFIAEEGNRRKDEIEEEINALQDVTKETKETVKSLMAELDSLELHDCPSYSREYNFFKPYSRGEKEGFKDYQKYGKHDFKRMEDLQNGCWAFIGIIAKAEIRTHSGMVQVIRSGGLWGIESDSGDYLDEVGKNELEGLRDELTSFGFGKRAIDYAFKNIETID